MDSKSKKRDKAYEKNIIDTIKADNYQTAANVARIIKENDDIKELKHTDGTVYEYTRRSMRNMFGTKEKEYGTHGRIEKKVWCQLDTDNNAYIPMSQEQIDAFYTMYSQQKDNVKPHELTVFSDYASGLITKEERDKAVGAIGFDAYMGARRDFYNKYGYTPIKVPVYELSAFKEGAREALI